MGGPNSGLRRDWLKTGSREWSALIRAAPLVLPQPWSGITAESCMRLQAFLLAVAGAVFLTACSNAPIVPDYESPAFVWSQARHAYHSGDLAKANELLSQLQQSDNAFTPRARIWQIVLAGGMARGYSELADAYATGERVNRKNALAFHKQMMDLRAMAAHTALDSTQAVHYFIARDPSVEVQLGFDLPPGSAADPRALRRPLGGTMPIEAEVLTLQTTMVERGVTRAICQANGTEADSAQALEKFRSGEVKTPRATFLYAAARILFEVSDLFNYNRMDEPQRRRVMCEEALAALHSIPETKETTALATKIQAVLKKIPTS